MLAGREDLADLEVAGHDALVVQDVPALRVTSTFLSLEGTDVDDLSLRQGAENSASVVLVQDRDADQIWNQLFEGNIGSCTTFGTLELEDLRCTLSTTSAESEGMKMSWDTVSEPGIGPQAPASPQVSSIPRS